MPRSLHFPGHRTAPAALRGAKHRAARRALAVSLSASVLALAGCASPRANAEKRARADVKRVAEAYRPQDRRPDPAMLATNAGLDVYLRFAMLNQPKVEAAYFDWLGTVERIKVERSLPDPQLTFQADIASVVMSVMPGLMQMFPAPGKLRAMGRVASAESAARYFSFESAVLQTALDLKRAYYNLHFLDERIRISRETLALLTELEQIARTQNEVGQVTLQDVYRAQIEQDQLDTELANLVDSRVALLARFKGALGLTRDQADPPVPVALETTPLDLQPEDLLATAFARNPRLKAMEADVRMAEANIALAAKSRLPDFSLGLMADVKANPTMFRPLATLTLPVWRNRIAAEIAQAQAGKRAAEARLSGEQIDLTVDFAMKSYDYREITRTLALLQNQLIPKARSSLDLARSGYLAGQIDFFNLIDAERTLLNFQLSEVEARTRREIVLAELSLLIAGVPPPAAPLLAEPPDVSSRAHEPANTAQPQAAYEK